MNPKMHQSCKFPGPETSMDGYEEALEQYYQENMHKAMPKKKLQQHITEVKRTKLQQKWLSKRSHQIDK